MPEILFVLIVLMIIGSLVAIQTPHVLHSVISVGAVGFLLSIVFLFLSAPDLAITQIAVEVITLVLLLRATIGSKRNSIANNRRLYETVIMVAGIVILAMFAWRVCAELPAFGRPVMDRFADAPSNTYLRDGLEETGAPNIVTAILLDFRAFDTLGEVTVLFCAIVGALSVLRRQSKARETAAGVESPDGTSAGDGADHDRVVELDPTGDDPTGDNPMGGDQAGREPNSGEGDR